MKSSFLIIPELRKILAETTNFSSENIHLNDDLFANGVLDSFGIIEFVVALEKHYDYHIPPEELIPQNLWSLQAVADMLNRLGVAANKKIV